MQAGNFSQQNAQQMQNIQQAAPYQAEVHGVPICYACRQEIYEPYMVAFRMNWHAYHIVCNLCKRDFSDGRQLTEGKDGCAYCQPCYASAFAPKCGKCKEIITSGQMVKAGIQTFHPEHFTCTKCDIEFGGVFFIGNDGMPYCEKHYYENQGQWCAGCEGPIVAGKMIKMGGKSYHTEHFFCKYRKEKLAGREYFEHKGEPYCKPCYLELFG